MPHLPIPDGPPIKGVVADVDGCLTDGSIYRTASGDVFRRYHTHDGVGFQMLREAGVAVGWLSSTNERASVVGRAEMVGVEHVHTGKGDKGPRLLALCHDMGVSPEDIAYLGDDIIDLPAIERAALSACPADAQPAVRSRVHVVLTKEGGRGALRELVELLFASGRIPRPDTGLASILPEPGA